MDRSSIHTSTTNEGVAFEPMIEEHITDEASLEGRLESKKWKVRSEAYLELKRVTYIPDSFANYLRDINPIAQESALIALESLLGNNSLNITLKEDLRQVIIALLDSCITSVHTPIQKQAMKLVIKLLNSEFGKETIEVLIELLNTKKTVNIIIPCLQVLYEFIHKHKSNDLDLQRVFPIVEKYAVSSENTTIRREAMKVVKEVGRGDGVNGNQQEECKRVEESTRNNHFTMLAERRRNRSLLKDERSFYEIKAKVENTDKLLNSISRERTAKPLMIIDTKSKDIEKTITSLLTNTITKETLNNLSILIKKNTNESLYIIGNIIKSKRENIKQHKNSLIHLVLDYYKHNKLIKAVDHCLEALVPNNELPESLECIKEELLMASNAIKINLCNWLKSKLLKITTQKVLKAIANSDLVNVLSELMKNESVEVNNSLSSCIEVINSIDITLNEHMEINKEIEFEERSSQVLELREAIDARAELRGNLTSRQQRQSLVKETNAIESFLKVKSQNISNTENLLKSSLSSTMIEQISSGNWKDHQKALSELYIWMKGNIEESKTLMEHLLQYLKYKLKGFNQKNLLIFKKLVEIFQLMVSFNKKSKRMVELVVPDLVEMVVDTKLSEQCLSLILKVAEQSNIFHVVQQVLNKLKEKNRLSIKGCLMILIAFAEKFSLQKVVIKTILENTKVHTLSSDKQINDLAQNLHNILNKAMVKDISIGKTVEVPKAEEIESNATTANNVMRTNFLARVRQELLEDIASHSITTRQLAKDQLTEMLLESERISSIGLGKLITALKDRMQDPSRKLCGEYIKLLGNFIKKMGSGAKQYAKLILPGLIERMVYKEPYIRTEAITALNKFSEAAGTELVINYMNTLMLKANQETKIQILLWISTHTERLVKAEYGPLLGVVLECLQGNSKTGHKVAMKLIVVLLPIVGEDYVLANIHLLRRDIKEKVLSLIKQSKMSVDTNSEGGVNILELKEVCKKVMSNTLVELMFGKVEDIGKAIQILKDSIKQGESFGQILSPLLKWINSLLVNSPKLVKDVISLLKLILKILVNNKYQLNDIEAKILFNMLAERLTKNSGDLSEVIDIAIKLYDKNKLNKMLIAKLEDRSIRGGLMMILKKLAPNSDPVNKLISRAYAKISGDDLVKYKRSTERYNLSPSKTKDTNKIPLKSFYKTIAISKSQLTTIKDTITAIITEEVNKEVLKDFTKSVENTSNYIEIMKDIDKVLEVFGKLLKEKLGVEGEGELVLELISAFNKLTLSRKIIQSANRLIIEQTLENLISSLLIALDNDETLIEDIDSIINKMLSNCDPTDILCSLIRLMRNNNPKFTELTAKYLTNQIKDINKSIPFLVIKDILFAIREYSLSPNATEIKLTVIKGVLAEVVNNIGTDIWEHYKHIKADKYIKQWISNMLASSNVINEELNEIIEEFKVRSKFLSAIRKLKSYQLKHPECNLYDHLKVNGTSFAMYVLSTLSKYKLSQRNLNLCVKERGQKSKTGEYKESQAKRDSPKRNSQKRKRLNSLTTDIN